MSKKLNAKYVFRGSTIGWPGNTASRQMPRTPTTTNPVKALLFALCCRDKAAPAVIYIAKIEGLKEIKVDANVLVKVEEEIGFIISPADFILLCDGYLPLSDAITIFGILGITIPPLYDRALFDMALKDAPKLSKVQVEQFYDMALVYLQKP